MTEPRYPANNFAHHDYARVEPQGRHELISSMSVTNSSAIDVSAAMRQHRVAAIYLVHGTFVGDDILGLFRKVATVTPSLADWLSGLGKKTLDGLISDAGNYPPSYAQRLGELVNQAGSEGIAVRTFLWSGENSHAGRCDGAVRFLVELMQQTFAPASRVLLWGHSHGGNLLALLTNLLGAETAVREKFFQAASTLARPLLRRTETGHWLRARQAFCGPRGPLDHVSLDIATFGTPIRYGWDMNVAQRLIHFVNHRCCDGLPQYQAGAPRSIQDVLGAAYGDVVQQFGMAGTGVSPGFWSWRCRMADRRLRRLLQAGVRRRDLWNRLAQGKRVSDFGTTLLVDYPDAPRPPRQPMFGHAAYTRLDWQEFHLNQIVRRFYPP